MPEDDTSPTGDLSTASPAADTALAVADTPVGDLGAVDAAHAALDQATPAPSDLDTVLSAIPADDNDLQSYQGQQVYQPLVDTRRQVRVLSNAIRELQPLRVYQQFGDPASVKQRLEVAKLLYSPLIRDGKPVIDPHTKTPYTTTKPFVEHLDRVSPGMPEQLLVDLLHLVTENPSILDAQGNPIKEPLVNQVWRYHKLDPRRLTEYQQIDAIIARTSGAITPDELAEIDSEYHAAYRTVPAVVRAAWKSYEPHEQLQILNDYKGKLDAAARDADNVKRDEARKAREEADHAALVTTEQGKYLDTVRRERTASMIASLSEQVTFSTDPVTNSVLIGTLAASMAQLLDPQWRFVTAEYVLKPLGLALDHTFDEALAKFDSNAANSVAYRLAGDVGQADVTRDEAGSAANQLMAKMAIFALKVAVKQGATVVEKAATQGSALAAAANGRPAAGTGSAAQPLQGEGLPKGMIPGSREAVEYIGRRTGMLR